MKLSRGLLVLLLLLISQLLVAQSTRVRGKVADAKTGEVLPLVNVWFTGTTIGVTTDFDGIYSLETREDVNELQVTLMGYESFRVKVNKGAFNQLDIKLNPQALNLGEVVVRPGINPAHAILRKVIEHKKFNDIRELPGYRLTTYTKMELDLININPEFKNKKLQKNFGFIFDHMDTSVINGKPFLPVMITEANANYYYRKSPRLEREVINASRVSGIKENFTLAQFTGKMHVDANFYDNYMELFEVRFTSPLATQGLLFYKYFLVDSLQMEGRKIYKIRFHPKGHSVPVLDGEINIDSVSWALVSARVRMEKGVNVNWIRDLVIEQQNTLLGDSMWFRKQDKLFADFSIHTKDSSKVFAFLGNRQVDYSNIVLTDKIPREIEKMDNNVVITRNVLVNDEVYWDSVRPYELSVREKDIYKMVDSVKNVPLYQNIYDIINTVMFGYYDTKYIGIGPYSRLYSFNELEGSRFQLGARTTEEFNKKIRLFGHVAYSTKDHKFKGGGGVSLLFNEMPRSMLTASYKYDVMQLGATGNFLEGDFLGSVFARGNNDRLNLVNEWNLKYEKEWRQGVVNAFGAQVREIYASPNVPFIRSDGEFLKSIQTSVLQINTHLSKNEVIVRDVFDRYSLGSDYPMIDLNMSMGLKGIFKNDYEFYRLELAVDHDFDIPPIGFSNVRLAGGKIFGKVPYPLLKLHEGNATYFYDNYAFSCMNFYEFASDMWAALFWEHHFKGFFLGKIPLLKKLQWREVFTFKALIGTLSDKNNGSLPNTSAILFFPNGMTSVTKPYVETGVGIENIFRIFRVDAIWRLTHREDRPGQNVQNFAINLSLHLSF